MLPGDNNHLAAMKVYVSAFCICNNLLTLIASMCFERAAQFNQALTLWFVLS